MHELRNVAGFAHLRDAEVDIRDVTMVRFAEPDRGSGEVTPGLA